MEMKRLVVWGGGLQVLLTTSLTLLVFYLLGWTFKQAVLFGFLLALSSTAIVLKTYSDRLEVDTPHGRAGIGILLFQDLCIVPMMLMVPILSGREGASAKNIAITLGTAVAAVALIIFTARRAVPFLLGHIVKLRSQEVFIIFVVLVSFRAGVVFRAGGGQSADHYCRHPFTRVFTASGDDDWRRAGADRRILFHSGEDRDWTRTAFGS
jgi:CPA2 family monovalent cation:H+ antiporter-2